MLVLEPCVYIFSLSVIFHFMLTFLCAGTRFEKCFVRIYTERA